MEYDLEKVLLTIKDEKIISVSFIQRKLILDYSSALDVYNNLITNGYMSTDGIPNKQKICLELGEENKQGTKIIFLDIDGVLNCHSTKDSCGKYRGIEDKKVSFLKKIVDATGAIIVLTSSWKENWIKAPRFKPLQDELAIYLDKKLEKQGLTIFDKTEDCDPKYRGDGILEYLRLQSKKGIDVENYIIIDDETFDYKETKLTPKLIQTSFYKDGLEEKHVRMAVQKL